MGFFDSNSQSSAEQTTSGGESQFGDILAGLDLTTSGNRGGVATTVLNIQSTDGGAVLGALDTANRALQYQADSLTPVVGGAVDVARAFADASVQLVRDLGRDAFDFAAAGQQTADAALDRAFSAAMPVDARNEQTTRIALGIAGLVAFGVVVSLVRQ